MDSSAAIDLATQEKANFARGIDKWRYIKEVPEGISVFAIVEEELDGFFTVFNRDAKTLGGFRVGVGTLEEPTVAGYYISPAVAGDRDKSVRRKDNGIVGSSGNG